MPAGGEAVPRTVTVVCCRQWGDPAEVLRVEGWELGEPGPGQVLVEMRAAPVNPADINVIEGRYGKQPLLPATIGNEGVGEVVQLGPGVTGFAPGQWVRPVPGVGSWQEALIARPADLTPLPSGLTVEQAATLCVNPATAWRMLHDFVALAPGDWVVQNAGTSAVGRAVIELCRHLGHRTASVVRREEAIDELRALGGDVVVTEAVHLGREIERLTGGPRPRLALNGVGGPSALNLVKALAPGATVVTYGAMGKAPLSLPGGLLIFNNLRAVGFWVTAWYERADPEATAAMLEELGRLLQQGALTVNIEARYPLAEAPAAVAHARREGRRGKVLLVA
jgi:trans-2-enoyl-CoA reductase